MCGFPSRQLAPGPNVKMTRAQQMEIGIGFSRSLGVVRAALRIDGDLARPIVDVLITQESASRAAA